MNKRAHYVFAYDIGDYRRQYQIRKALQAYTIGRQKSLYECWLTPAEHQALCRTISRIIQPADKVLAFKLPAVDSSQMYGQATRLTYQPFLMI